MTEAILKGLALGFILTLSVGPVIFTIIKQSINNGKEGGFSFVFGVWISDILLVLVSNVFSEWMSHVMTYKRTIGGAGSLFLVAMGVYFVYFKKVKPRTAPGAAALRLTGPDFARLAGSGFLLNTFNPGVIFFWLLNATAFAVSHTMEQRILIFGICLTFNMLADVGKVLMAERLGKRLTIANMRILNKVSGTVLIGFGLALLYGAVFVVQDIKPGL